MKYSKFREIDHYAYESEHYIQKLDEILGNLAGLLDTLSDKSLTAMVTKHNKQSLVDIFNELFDYVRFSKQSITELTKLINNSHVE